MKEYLINLDLFCKKLSSKKVYNTLANRFLLEYPKGFAQHLGIIAEKILRDDPFYKSHELNRYLVINKENYELDACFMYKNIIYALEFKTNHELDKGKCTNIIYRSSIIKKGLQNLYPNNFIVVETICLNNYNKNKERNKLIFRSYDYLEKLGFMPHNKFLNKIKTYCNLAKFKHSKYFK